MRILFKRRFTNTRFDLIWFDFAAAAAAADDDDDIKRLKPDIACSSWESISELRGVTCHMGSHSVTCHPTQVNAPRHNPSQTGRYSIYLPRRDGRLSRPR